MKKMKIKNPPFPGLRRWFRSLKLQNKFLAVLVLTIVLPLSIIGLLISTRIYDLISSDTIRQAQAETAQAVPEINKVLSHFLQAMDTLQKQDFFRSLFFMPIEDDPDVLASSVEAQVWKQQIDSLKDEYGFSSIRVYLGLPESAEELFQSRYTKDSLFPAARIRGTYWHGILQAVKASELYCPPAYLGIRERSECGDVSWLQATTVYYKGQAYPAYIVFYYPEEIFSEALTQHLTLEGSVSYLINDRSNLVVSTDDSLAGIYYLNYDTIEGSVMSSNSFIERSVVNESVYAAYYRTDLSDWFLVTILPQKQLRLRSNNTMLKYTAAVLAVLFLVMSGFTLLVRSITRRIQDVAGHMQQVRQGVPMPMDSPDSLDEIGDLVDTYNYMARRMQQLMDNQAKAAEDLRIAEFHSLQAQINPHFLYNTMDMIHWMAVQGRTEEIGDAVQKLSRFYKLTLSKKERISTIAMEEEHVSIYVELQNMRFGGKINYISDIPDELLSCRIPSLTLQPVVENAVLHGILEKEDKTGSIVLTGWTENDDVILLISDDGVGIAPDILERILSPATTQHGKGTNIAVYNTHRRLELLYGKGYGLCYSSEPGKGTEVQIRIPDRR